MLGRKKGKMSRERNWELENKRKEEGIKDYWRGKEDEAVIETADKEKKENRVLKRKRITRGKRPPRRRLKRKKTIKMKLKKKGGKPLEMLCIDEDKVVEENDIDKGEIEVWVDDSSDGEERDLKDREVVERLAAERQAKSNDKISRNREVLAKHRYLFFYINLN